MSPKREQKFISVFSFALFMLENMKDFLEVNFPNVITQFLRIIEYHPLLKKLF